jgi:hypothetical protein
VNTSWKRQKRFVIELGNIELNIMHLGPILKHDFNPIVGWQVIPLVFLLDRVF